MREEDGGSGLSKEGLLQERSERREIEGEGGRGDERELGEGHEPEGRL